jgi:hypothetical protein
MKFLFCFASFSVLGIRPWDLHLLSKNCNIELHPKPLDSTGVEKESKEITEKISSISLGMTDWIILLGQQVGLLLAHS